MFKKKQIKQMKNFVMYESYFPETGLFKTRDGFARAWYLEDFDAVSEDDYELAVRANLIVPASGSTQICHIAGKDVIVVTIPAETPEKAFSVFNVLFREPGIPVPIKDWFHLVAQSMQFQDFSDAGLVGATGKKGKPSAVLLPKIQPYVSDAKYDTKGKEVKHTDTKMMDINNQYVRTVLLTNFPGYIYPSLLTEILRLSKSISSSLFLKRVDKEKCTAAFDRFPVQMSSMRMQAMKERLLEKGELYHTCLMISVHADTKDNVNQLVKRVQDVAVRYLTDINVLEHQQVAAFKSMAPLGLNYIRCNKVLERDAIAGLMPLSWTRHVSNGVSYGMDKVTGVEILYNRLLTGENGFLLGSDMTYIERRIIQELRQFEKERPGIRAAIFTVDASACPLLSEEFGVKTVSRPLVCGNWAVDREVLRVVTVSVCGHNGELAREKRNLMEDALAEPVSKYSDYVSRISERNPSMGRQLSAIHDSIRSREDLSGIRVYQCGSQNARYAERMAVLMQMLAEPGVNFVYVVSAETLASSDLIRFCQKNYPGVLFTWASITKDGSGLRKMYLGKGTGEAIQTAHFLDISRHEVGDRVQLRSLLDFGPGENAVLASQDTGTGLLMAGDTMYIYEEKEEGADEQGTETGTGSDAGSPL